MDKLEFVEPKGGSGPDDPRAWYEVPVRLMGTGNVGTREALRESLERFLEDDQGAALDGYL